MDKVVINGKEFISIDEINKDAEPKENMPYVLVRSDRAGVFIGYLKSKEVGSQISVVLVDSRNIFYWNGASGISQIAEEGIKDHESSKITIPVRLREINGVIEIIHISEKAKINLDKIEPWKK